MIPWLWPVALTDFAFALILFGLSVRLGGWIRRLVLAAAVWCLIESLGHAWLENLAAYWLREVKCVW